MYVLFNVMCLSYMTLILTINLQETESDQKGPGDSSCDIAATYCNETTFWNQYPDGCLSFVFCCLYIDEKQTINFMFESAHNELLDKLGQSGKKLYLNFGRYNYTAWTTFLDCDGNNAMKDVNALNMFTSKHSGITGLLLKNLEPAVDETIEIVGYTQRVAKYIEVLKQNTGLEIALFFHSDNFLAYYDQPQMSWLNFTVIDSCVDFYVFGLYGFFGECSGGSSGRISITGDETNTLEKLESAIQKSLIPKQKIYFDLPLGPNAMVDTCISNYQTLCKSPDIAKSWCSETQETYFKQGQWYRQNGAGFMGGYIDFDDPDNVCKCGKYPSFNAILAGFNGTASVPVCPLYDRSC